MYFATQLFSLSVRSRKKWFFNRVFSWQEMCFSDKNSVKWRNLCYFLLKKDRVKPGTVLIETVLSRDCLYVHWLQNKILHRKGRSENHCKILNLFFWLFYSEIMWSQISVGTCFQFGPIWNLRKICVWNVTKNFWDLFVFEKSRKPSNSGGY